MNEQEMLQVQIQALWTAVYVAAISNGDTTDSPDGKARIAVQDFKAQFCDM